MDLNQFIQQSLTTESVVDQVHVNKQLTLQTIEIILAAGEILDQIKKNTFYGRQLDDVKIMDSLTTIDQNVSTLLDVAADPSELDETEMTEVETNPRIFHSVLGVVTESVELLEAIDLDSSDVDRVNVLEENGDINWYQSIMVDELEGDWSQILLTTIKKLQARFPDKFKDTDANNRDVDQERAVLEQGLQQKSTN